MSYLEIKANEWAQKNYYRFEEKIIKFKETNKYSESECKNIYSNYKQWCIFDNLIKVSYLFKDDYKQYKILDDLMNNAIDKDIFKDLYTNYFGNIYKKVFNKTTEKLSLTEKIIDSDKSIVNLKKCIIGRIQYHYNCQKYTKDYNIKSHKHEILLSLYMFNRIKEVQNLLNKFKDKYIVFKTALQIKAQKAYMELEDFENTSSSKNISEPFIQVNKTTRKKKK
jgi:hypothetical protein